MIRYKCDFCRIELETDDSLSGKEEACPGCQKINLVPLSQADRKANKLMKARQHRSGEVKRPRLQPDVELTQDKVKQKQSASSHVPRKAYSPYSELCHLSSLVIVLATVAAAIGIVWILGDLCEGEGFPSLAWLRAGIFLGAALQLMISGFILRGLYYIAVNTAPRPEGR